ncbi:MAG: LysR family transcriptional regulator [Clostridium sp.]
MNLKQLSYIVTIADTQNISHAADQLFISSSCTQPLSDNFEKELGYPIFKRIQKKMIPTDAGAIYIRSAREILEIKKQAYKAIDEVTRGESGCLNLELPA